MLDLDLDLEADLGIDTVKQAELFATVREAYEIERDDKLQLRDYPTLAHVIGFVRERGKDLPPVAAPSAPAAAVAPAAAPVAADPVAAKILELVAEQTGYPPEMLDLDLDLEADLGIDTVKQAELFATVRETYGIERDDKLQLRDYPTLAHVIGFVRERGQDLPPVVAAGEPAPEAGPVVEPPAGPGPAGGEQRYPRRVPVAVVRPALEQCEPTGVNLVGARVLVMPDEAGVADVLIDRLTEAGADVLRVDGAPEADDLVAQVTAWREAGPVTGVFWLAGLDDEASLAALTPDTWKEGLRRRVKLLASAMRVLYDDLAEPGRFLVSGTRLGGRLGYDEAGAQGVLGGAVSGFTKALARERAEATVKVVDVATDADPALVAGWLVAETLRDPGVVETGYADGLRWSVGLAEVPAVDDAERALGPDDVFVVTGAAGSIVSAITADLAAASGGTFHLLDLTPEPARDDPDLARFVSDRDGLKKDLAQRITDRGERATPALVERELARIERSRAALDAVEAVERAGGTPIWYQVDLTDAQAVAAVAGAIRDRSGKVDVLLHCAGLEISHFLPDKSPREYDLVFDVKSNGWFHLLHGFGDLPLGAAVVFSSIAGRFGNGGQTDYSAANDLLCKSVSSFRTTRPDTLGVAIDWTAWASIGMASRGSIPKMMALAGIDMLPPEEGVPVVRRELTAAGAGREVVVAGSLGLLLDERHPTGGFAPVGSGDAPMTGELAAATLGEGLVVRTTLDPAAQPFLDHHRIDGTPVLPGVMGIESFAEAAARLVPGWSVVAVEDVDFLAPFKCYRDEPRTVEVRARLRSGPAGTLVADCSLVGRRTLPNQPEQVTTHFTGRVVLAPTGPEAETVDQIPVDGEGVEASDIYRIYFHGPAYQVLERVWQWDEGQVVGRLARDLGPNHTPPDLPLIADPRLVELCFQTAGVWELGTTGRMALPQHVDRISVHPWLPGDGAVHAIVTPRDDGAVDAVVVDEDGEVRIRMEGYRTVALPGGPDDDLLVPLRTAMA
jgi:NAD(P)-dependent dehydrogenase (short-subunit alcohol dehydrogenase family)/acyl carrier protein